MHYGYTLRVVDTGAYEVTRIIIYNNNTRIICQVYPPKNFLSLISLKVREILVNLL